MPGSTSAKRFSPATLDRVREAPVVGVRAGRGHRIIAVWVVVVGSRVFVRSWRVSPGGWFHAFKREREGALVVGSRRIGVSAIHTKSEPTKRKVSQAYAEKYHTPGSRGYVRDFARRPSLDATIELIPRRPRAKGAPR